MITIIDYGLGNIRAFVNLYERQNVKIKVARTADELKSATKIILPGVGAFDHAITLLNRSGLREELEKQVFLNKVPVIGICVGMQILARSSDEGKLPGLGWIEGEVKLIDASKIPFKTRLPHMGWNSIAPENNCSLLDGFDNTSRFYFLHSYYFVCDNEKNSVAKTSYGFTFSSAVNKENIYGIQFHPEKSHNNGIRLLLNFSKI
jgi:glutamine amidotransferase